MTPAMFISHIQQCRALASESKVLDEPREISNKKPIEGILYYYFKSSFNRTTSERIQ